MAAVYKSLKYRFQKMQVIIPIALTFAIKEALLLIKNKTK